MDKKTKKLYPDLLKIIINNAALAKLIINIIIAYNNISNFMIGNKNALFLSKVLSFLSYFLNSK